jgi:hypothetical protein
MIRATAQRILSEVRQDIQRQGWDTCEKRHLLTVFNDIKNALCDPHSPTYDPYEAKVEYKITAGLTPVVRLAPKRLAAVCALERRLQNDRQNKFGGADSIDAILAELEGYVTYLPAEIKPQPVLKWPSKAEMDADNVVEELKRRGLVHA